ncbi:hypothetical protein BAE44_0025958, partial [Dichanthelium oligosanthes]
LFEGGHALLQRRLPLRADAARRHPSEAGSQVHHRPEAATVLVLQNGVTATGV